MYRLAPRGIYLITKIAYRNDIETDITYVCNPSFTPYFEYKN